MVKNRSGYNAKYWTEHKEQITARRKQYYKDHKEEIDKRNKEWLDANREWWNAYMCERRAKQKLDKDPKA